MQAVTQPGPGDSWCYCSCWGKLRHARDGGRVGTTCEIRFVRKETSDKIVVALSKWAFCRFKQKVTFTFKLQVIFS